MTKPGVRWSVDGSGIVTAVIDRPERHNAYDGRVLAALDDLLARTAEDRAVRALSLRGEGAHFSAGADVAWLDAGEPDGPDLAGFLYRFSAYPKPTVALVQGACVGGGIALAACCDVVVASRDAFFSIPEVRLGFTPAPLLPLLSSALGGRALRRYALTGERFDAAEAQHLGVVHVLCEIGMLEESAARVIDALLRGAPDAMSVTKAAIGMLSANMDGSRLRTELAHLGEVSRGSAEAAEGRAAFAEKRAPAWYKPDAGQGRHKKP